MIKRAIQAHCTDGNIDWDAASKHITALRRFHMKGIKNPKKQRGVTNEYTKEWAVKLGLVKDGQ